MYFRTLRSTVGKNSVYFSSCALVLLAGAVVQASFSQFNISLFVNGINHAYADFFFKYLTHMGDAYVFAGVILLLLVYKRQYALSAATIALVATAVTQLLKRLIFDDLNRPHILMKDLPQLHYVDGVYMNQFNSFPSGHTLSAFAMFTFLAMMSHEKRYGLFFLVPPVVVGYSRIYLLQHFFRDVLAGALLGTLIALLVFAAFENRKKTAPHA